MKFTRFKSNPGTRHVIRWTLPYYFQANEPSPIPFEFLKESFFSKEKVRLRSDLFERGWETGSVRRVPRLGRKLWKKGYEGKIFNPS